jgi:hypothetical protein
VTMLTARTMTAGQLKLSYGALCVRHGCDGATGLGYASRVSVKFLRQALMKYEVMVALERWTEAEDALLSVAEFHKECLR